MVFTTIECWGVLSVEGGGRVRWEKRGGERGEGRRREEGRKRRRGRVPLFHINTVVPEHQIL